ncbi:hypothetical protein BST81_17105 [Leptolyngbya sp. 'hensonii']|uniref:hypothetical protein n=1 Tax=Leptolyngbya sp. 'hensonii' TaxID=1922337 RepID=UPI0009501418|nr:hypothetical protein [Leptolyngbya sp. 'hensonii']OLP17077.1 hypothetical protein BST81_17105 [Leptolyngbya sp. 'hensonii']
MPPSHPLLQYRHLVITLMLPIALAACTNRPKASSNPATPVVTNPATIASTWYNYTSPTGKYTARFPGKPREDTRTLDTKAGKTNLVLVTYEDKSAKRAYALSHNKFIFPSGMSFDVQKGLDGSRDGLARGMGATITQETKITAQGFPGREITLNKGETLLAKARIFYVNGTLYQMFVLVDGKQLDAPEVTAFLESVEFQK